MFEDGAVNPQNCPRSSVTIRSASGIVGWKSKSGGILWLRFRYDGRRLRFDVFYAYLSIIAFWVYHLGIYRRSSQWLGARRLEPTRIDSGSS